MYSLIGKLLGLATVGGTLASVGMLHRFLSGIASIVMLAIVSGFMICALITGAFYLAFLGLINAGIEPAISGVIVGGIALIVTAILVTLTYVKLDRLRDASRRELPRSETGPLDISTLASAFIEGFFSNRD